MFKKRTYFAITLLSVLIILGGCNSSSSNGSYAGILMVNEKEYYWQGGIKDSEFNLGEEIYSSNEDSKVIIVKRDDGSLEKMTEENYSKNN